MAKKHIVVLSGAGVSAESGISTFRDSKGLWEQYDVMQVASIDGWYVNPALIQKFYNERRAQLNTVEPNEGHHIIASLEKDFRVTVVTQNVDNLHERAGSTNVIHLHGELTKACNESKTQVIDIGLRPIAEGEKAADGSRLRPFIVWFGEAVPLIDEAARSVQSADIVIIVGTSMQVYPAAGLIHYTKPHTPIYLVDPAEVSVGSHVKVIKEKASKGMAIVRDELVISAQNPPESPPKPASPTSKPD
ncbi:MAG: NAD-dependent deacylase [Candidatus Symbiothrix sp.]|jgi:NAD-dependent deacetylase|nr:NAD-dependent deacylase [Candidatus Symbiothrix sp.]